MYYDVKMSEFKRIYQYLLCYLHKPGNTGNSSPLFVCSSVCPLHFFCVCLCQQVIDMFLRTLLFSFKLKKIKNLPWWKKCYLQRNLTTSNCYLCYMFSSIVALCDVDDFFTVSYIKCHVVNKQGICCWKKTGQSGVYYLWMLTVAETTNTVGIRRLSCIIYSFTVSIAYWFQQYYLFITK